MANGPRWSLADISTARSSPVRDFKDAFSHFPDKPDGFESLPPFFPHSAFFAPLRGNPKAQLVLTASCGNAKTQLVIAVIKILGRNKTVPIASFESF